MDNRRIIALNFMLLINDQVKLYVVENSLEMTYGVWTTPIHVIIRAAVTMTMPVDWPTAVYSRGSLDDPTMIMIGVGQWVELKITTQTVPSTLEH